MSPEPTSPEPTDLHVPRICLDPLSGRPVFVAPQRGSKPNDAALVAQLGVDPATAHDWCPFCAGNEDRTPPDLARAPVDASAPWQARIVPNRYPITTIAAAEITPGAEGRPAHGVHEVVIESPRHDRSILAVDPAAWRDVWSLCGRRLAMLAAQESLAWATVFKNSGPKAGASLEHVHSQLVALDRVPPTISSELAGCRGGRDPFGVLLAEARAAGRIVAELGGLVVVVPPAPRQPFETWIVTAEPERHFHDTPPARAAALADLTRDMAGRLERVAPGCEYNWWLHQAPFLRAAADMEPTAAWHWHLEILPRLAELAGFELGTGCHITTVTAEESARSLRAAGSE
ncbi:MAG: galactose-1-phosphate uridylyltransferase [Pirellulales bacterium]